MIQYAIFIEPQEELREAIIARKRLVQQMLLEQKYCNHPPHCTLIVGRYQKPVFWENAVGAAVQHIPPFTIETNRYHIFYNDELTGGGHTVVLKIHPSKALFQLQKVIADILGRYQVSQVETTNSETLNKEPFKSSNNQYGFPFVGDHWVPHFTIASLQVGRNSQILKDCLVPPTHFTCMVKNMSIWEVDGDKHERLNSISFIGH